MSPIFTGNNLGRLHDWTKNWIPATKNGTMIFEPLSIARFWKKTLPSALSKTNQKTPSFFFDANISNWFRDVNLISKLPPSNLSSTLSILFHVQNLCDLFKIVSSFTARFPNKVHSRFLGWKISTPTLSLAPFRRLKLLEEKLRFIGESSQSWAALEELEWLQTLGILKNPFWKKSLVV